MKQVNKAKEAFVLQYILNARLSGRTADVESRHQRTELVQAAGDLYDQSVVLCTEEVEPETGEGE